MKAAVFRELEEALWIKRVHDELLRYLMAHAIQQIIQKAQRQREKEQDQHVLTTVPPLDCTRNPNDPSCTQTLAPQTSAPTTKTCPDGSVIDASATCPTQSTPPSTGTPAGQPQTSGIPSPPSGNNNGHRFHPHIVVA